MTEAKTDCITQPAREEAGQEPRARRGARVLQVLPAMEAGGVARAATDIAAALAKAGGASFVASSGGPLVYDLEKIGLRHITLPLDSKNPLVMYRNAGKLTELIYDNNIDIVHARSRAPAWSALLATRRAGCHFVTTYHGTYNGGCGLKNLYNSVMTRSGRIIAISDFIADHVQENYSLETSRLVTIPRGINTENFDPVNVSAERVIQLVNAWRLPDGVPVVLLPGRLTRWKGHPVLLRALALMERRDLCCVIVGSDQGRTQYRTELENLTNSLGLGEVVRIVDHCRDMAAAYMLADVVVSASTDPEAFGRVTAEAQAMGRPVVATEHGASGETIIPDQTGWLVPHNNPDALARALEVALAIDAPTRQDLADRARRFITENLTVELMCGRTLDLYGSLIDSESVVI
jgi:glycosyltransferase involved in cell wall biosynthesis